jgi:hypothetical protein
MTKFEGALILNNFFRGVFDSSALIAGFVFDKCQWNTMSHS